MKIANLIAKRCANLFCKEYFDTKNPKKRFCCDHCKNQAAYRHRMSYYQWEVEMAKARLGNIKILEYLYNLKVEKITLKELRNMGFVIECNYYPYSEKENIKIYRFGNVGIIHTTNKDVTILKIEEENEN